MLQETQPQHKEGFMERFFERHQHRNKDHDENYTEEGDLAEGQDQKPQRGEGEMDKFRDYIHKDEELEQEGQTYGELM